MLDQEKEAEEAYAEATRLLEGKDNLPDWVQEFLQYDPEADESEDSDDLMVKEEIGKYSNK